MSKHTEVLEGILEPERRRKSRKKRKRSLVLLAPSQTLLQIHRKSKFNSLLQKINALYGEQQLKYAYMSAVYDIRPSVLQLLIAFEFMVKSGFTDNSDLSTLLMCSFFTKSLRSNAKTTGHTKSHGIADSMPRPWQESGGDEVVTTHGSIEPDKENIRQEPYSLPQGFMWDTLDMGSSEELKELYTLLNENYVEDDDNMFRFDYSPQFLQWALRPPGWLPQWHCGVRVSSNRKLVGFISAIPASIRIYEIEKKMVEINFLCVHKKLRSKRVAPVLIREITRRVNLEGIFQAVYTAGVVLPKPVATCRYWHRSLNPRKLVEVKFSHLSRNMTLQRTMKLYRLPDTPKTMGLRPMEQKDVKRVQELLFNYLKQFELAPVMSEEEVIHWLLPRENIIDTYVVEGSDGELTDFVSFYTLPSTVMHHPIHKNLKAAYSFYNVHTETPLIDLMNDALIIAKSKGFDVLNALDLMENKTFLEKLKFGIGDGNLQYYLYNWRCPDMEPEKVGLVLQ
ncbi:glycylpeptide N-tetradecanoyltransferase 2 isoform X2 [Scyliorhinus canicula]|uniref:glycylpeptide N-tetradecanoyltransferase 2 isoform X2 n=1 Tax=Scyliorhinus canicula TaxID=7830 RepID=UPI0018F72E24|nr:glycylpeptide N-tetradecanoyltransferase 2 isoform X2 [Scyliorhinus canicula]